MHGRHACMRTYIYRCIPQIPIQSSVTTYVNMAHLISAIWRANQQFLWAAFDSAQISILKILIADRLESPRSRRISSREHRSNFYVPNYKTIIKKKTNPESSLAIGSDVRVLAALSALRKPFGGYVRFAIATPSAGGEGDRRDNRDAMHSMHTCSCT